MILRKRTAIAVAPAALAAAGLMSAVAARQPGDKVSVIYVRSGATKTTSVTLGTRAS